MRSYLSENASQILDGLLFGLGVLAVYLGAVFTGALIRSLGGAGSKGLTFIGRYFTGWYDYLRGEDRDTINATLNTIVDGRLKFDTLVADRRVWSVWPNIYRIQLIRRAARRTTVDNPVLLFPTAPPEPRSRVGRFVQRCNNVLHGRVASVTVIKDGRAQRVLLERESDYKAVYGPLISLVSETCNTDNAIDLALGRPMDEYRFVIALTFEKLSDRRARHLRAMVMWEETLRNLPPDCPEVDVEEHRTRFRTLQSIARQYAENPGHFGIVKMWRPQAVLPPDRDALAETVRLAPAQAGT